MSDSSQSKPGNRDEQGRFPKGVSGNPKGRPKTYRSHLKKLIGKRGESAYDIVWAIARGETTYERWMSSKFGPERVPQEPTVKERLEAALALAEALNGKPVAAVALTDDKGEALSVTIQIERTVEGKDG